MKSVFKSVSFILATALMYNSAQARDGTIYVNGSLYLQTCTISVGGVVSPVVAAVKLPTVSDEALNASGKVTGRTGFQIELSNCTGNANRASAFFEAGADVESVSGQLINRGTAQNVRLQLLQNGSYGGVAIKIGDSLQATGPRHQAVIEAGRAMIPYAVQYISTGVTGAGNVRSSVNYTIIYE